ncbi:RDD family protein [Psychrobacter aestuarii]|uniref:RDD family protein n=1 Tax=Psychrobacter aestuarii TaxID=556327 RepID=A0ABN0VYE6_9GAMM|nr:RDD family protein [Psychrobacter aestuarii]
MQIFLARNNVQAGPYTLDQLNIMLASGEVKLDDLMWHEGFSAWQRVGDVTGNQAFYQPAHNAPTTPPTVQPTHPTSNTGTTSNPSVDRLYGKPESSQNSSSNTSKPNSVSLNKAKPATATEKDTVVGDVILAPIMSRILATALNGLLYLLSILPLIMALTKLDIDYSKFQNVQNLDAAYQYSLSLIESIPQGTLMMSQAMVFGLLGIQLLFITLRGQSLGKLITGIRVVDQTTHRLPSFAKRVIMRTIVLFLLYNILFSFTSFLGFAVIAMHYFLASKDDKNIGIHDRLAHTMVVKADSRQLQKPSDI